MRDGAALLLVLLVLVAVPGRGGLRVAICNPTLYGNVTLAALDKYARYHRGLGFAEAFVYVGKGSTPRHAKEYLRRSPFFRPVLHPHMVGNEHGQDRAIRHCHNLTRMLGYDWAMFSDLDEFVQWNRSALSVGEWLAADFRSKTIGCFTLGKRFFTGVYRAPSYRGLAAFPFTPPTPYCYGGRRGYDHNVCDGWRGRRKPFLRLSHPKAFVVGVHGCLCRGCTKVVPTEKAFFREYNGYTEYNPWHNPRARANYTTASVIKVKGVPNIPFHSESHKVGSVVKEDSVLEFMRRRLPRQSFAFYAAPARRA